ncbi:MAG: bifunctional nuclease domain-containing protein [Flavobacteriales bacterium]
MKLIQLDIVGLSNSQTQSGAFALVLGEVQGTRRLPIVIGNFEAKAIAIALDSEFKSQRPITHDLFRTLCKGYDIVIKKIVISSINSGGIFSSIIYCTDINGKEIEIDSRTSDAVAIAIRFKAPIFTYEAILSKAGIVLDKDVSKTKSIETESNEESNNNDFSSLSNNELKESLESAIENENYELASKLRDELKNRE